ncbi:MAG TPA: TonB-dependent receptor [Bryobacteraceae bacterium]|nr:TonB-dependent receptor [Bryobacteraceae bacterium]
MLIPKILSSTAPRLSLAGVIALAGLCVPNLARSQGAGGTISGVITDASGAVVPNAHVVIENRGTEVSRSATTNERGYYSAPNLIPGPYRVTASAAGFTTFIRSDLVLTVGAELEINIQLKPGEVSEKVEVTGEAPDLETATSSLGNSVRGGTIRELPLNGRDWTQLAALEPGVATVRTEKAVANGNDRANRGLGSFLTVAGARPEQNNYRVDGISINDYSNGAPGSVLGVDLGVDSIQEFSVVTGNASAEYGKVSGGVVNAVSRSGTNDFHGTGYEFLRNSAMDARNFFDKAIPPFKRNQFGASAGGPIQRDRTFIFGDYEGLRQSLGVTALSTVPSLAARSGQLVAGPVTVDPRVAPFLALYPQPNGAVNGDYGTFSLPYQQVTVEDFATTRVDHRFNDRDSLFGTYLYDTGNVVAPDPFDVRTTASFSGRQLATLEETHIASPALVNTFRFGYSRSVSDAPRALDAINKVASDPSLGFFPGQNVGLINIAGVANFQGGLGAVGEYDFNFNSYQLYDEAFYTRGTHSIKFGVSVERLQANQIGKVNPAGQFIFGSLKNFLIDQPTTFNAPLSGTITPRDLRQSIVGAFVQDDWRAKPNLTVNLGLRYEITTVPTEVHNELSTLASLTDKTPHLGPPYFQNPTLRNFSPRVGFAWDPFHNGKTSVRGAFGVYDVLPMTYLFELLSILTAPYNEAGSVGNLPAGTFPTGAYALLTPTTLRYSYVEQNPRRSYLLQWNFNIERELMKDLALKVGYIGSHGVHIPFRADDVNTVQPVATPQGYQWPTPAGSGTLLNPNVGQISALMWQVSSAYQGLDAQVTRRMAHGIQLQASYTWAKSIDSGSSSIAGDTFGNSVSSLFFFDPRLRRGLSDFDIRQNLVFSYLWQISTPAGWTSPLAWAAKGWQVGGIFQVSSGMPFTATIGGDPLGLKSADPYAYPDRLNSPGCNSPVNPGNPGHYINTSCFAAPNPGTRLGDDGRNTLIGPGLENLDFSLFKNNPVRSISETFNVQFRFELFNILNHANFQVPVPANRQIFNSSLQPISTAGVLTSTATTSRQIQLAIKVIW